MKASKRSCFIIFRHLVSYDYCCLKCQPPPDVCSLCCVTGLSVSLMYTREFENKQTMTITLKTHSKHFISVTEAAVPAAFGKREWLTAETTASLYCEDTHLKFNKYILLCDLNFFCIFFIIKGTCKYIFFRLSHGHICTDTLAEFHKL